MLTPGVSANNRLYTAEAIRKAHNRLTERLSNGLPVSMLTHHMAGDDSTRIVGKVTGVSMGDGDALNYTAELAPTLTASELGSLIPDFLRSVSIRGWWASPPVTKTVNGQSVETADDLVIDGLDFTKNPGVAGATVTTDGTPTETDDGRVVIIESVTAHPFTETAPPKPVFADPGYLGGVKRFPLNNLTETRAAAGLVTERATDYTPRQLKRIRGRIKTALTTFGDTMPDFDETTTRVGDVTEFVGDTGTAGFSISAYNGPLTVNVSAYDGIEPADLPGIATAAMTAALQAVHALDPDNDGDIDTGATGKPVADTAPNPTDPSEPEPRQETAPKETPVTETATEPLTVESVQQMIETALAKAAPIPTTEPAEENAPENQTGGATEETTVAEQIAEQIAEAVKTAKAEAVEAAKAAWIAEQRKRDAFTRKGLVAESDAVEKPLHEMSDDELRAEAVRRLVPAVMAGARDT